MIDLSILVCSTHTRYKSFGVAIQDQIWPQYHSLSEFDQDRVEIIMLTDNKKMMLGEKRNIMVDMAQGRYIQFIDDDDRIEPDMFKTLLTAIDASNADVITFLAKVSLNGGKPKICRYSKDFGRDYNTPTEYRRIPNHICCVKKEISVKASFPNLLYGEDCGYSKLLLPHIKTEYAINRVLYHYDYDSNTTETQIKQRAGVRKRDLPPIVDVIILSNAKTNDYRAMTQNTIDSCIAGANALPVNIIVMEQQNVQYRGAQTVYAPESFNYNAFANRAARLGNAEWIMVANNDLIFEDGWLHNLLAANHPVVSPHNPGDYRQGELTENTTGTENGRHFSGWCFMLRRELWNKIGGFDESIKFWCSDDVTVEQVVAAGVEPMIVPSAIVKHLKSKTLGVHNPPDELTWQQVHIYNTKYGRDKFANHPSYKRWKAKNGVA